MSDTQPGRATAAMKLVMVGAGEATRSLLRRLGESWDVAIVDRSAERLEGLKGERPFEAFEGDGSSRLVLKRAGLEEADALVAATDDDDVNLEVCRIGRASEVRRVVAVVAEASRAGEYRELGVPAHSPAQLLAKQLELELEPRRVTSSTFAKGRVEAMEFQVTADSPVRGMPVAEVNSAACTVVAILRGQALLFPEADDLQLETDDLVTVVGPATALPDIVRIFTSSMPRFPLDFGKRVIVPLVSEIDRNAAFVEALALTRNTGATSLVVLYEGPAEEDLGGSDIEPVLTIASSAAGDTTLERRPFEGHPRRTLARLAQEESVGVVVLPESLARGPRFTTTSHSVSLLRRTATPVLVARRRDSYQRILVGARRTDAGRAAVGAAIDLAAASRAELEVLAVVDPEFISGPGSADEARFALDWAREQALVHGLRIRPQLATGNPVRAFLRVAQTADLVVLGISQEARPRSFRSTVGARLVEDAAASVLLVPAPRRL